MAASDGQSSLIEAYSYNAYGKPAFFDVDGRSEMKGSKVGNRFLFQGMLYDADSALYFTPARAYKPDWGRWLSPDPIGAAGGSNLYAFVGGRPLNFADPSGLCGSANNAKPPVWQGPTFAPSSAMESTQASLRKFDAKLLHHLANLAPNAQAFNYVYDIFYGSSHNPDTAGLSAGHGRDSKAPFIDTAGDEVIKAAQVTEAVVGLATAPHLLARTAGASAFEPGIAANTVNINRYEAFAADQKEIMMNRVRASVTKGEGIVTQTSERLAGEAGRGVSYREQIRASYLDPVGEPLPGEKTGKWLEFTHGPNQGPVKTMMHHPANGRYQVTFEKAWNSANPVTNPEGGIHSNLFDTIPGEWSFESGVGFLAPEGQGVVVDAATILDTVTGQVIRFVR
jgi:RHS repeat-associated protein